MESEDRQTRKSNLRLLFEALVVGLVAGIVVGSFRWLIGQTLAMWQKGYQAAHANSALLWLLAGGVLASVIVAGFLVKQQPHAGGSGIPGRASVAGQAATGLANLLAEVRRRVLSIGSGLFLAGRSVNPIGLNSRPGGLQGFKASKSDSRVLLATGRPAACPRPSGHLWGAMFIVEEVFHNFSPGLAERQRSHLANLWLQCLWPDSVLAIDYSTASHPQYWQLLLLGAFLAIGRFYQWACSISAMFIKNPVLPRWHRGSSALILVRSCTTSQAMSAGTADLELEPNHAKMSWS